MEYSINTRCIHGKNQETKQHTYGSLGAPIYQTATFAHPGVGQSTGYDYSRESNPTMKVTDLRAMKQLADKYGLLLIVDNTFLYNRKFLLAEES